jgi:hypothetical protein
MEVVTMILHSQSPPKSLLGFFGLEDAHTRISASLIKTVLRVLRLLR